MFEKEKKQYDEDCKTHERPWKFWEYKAKAVETWKPLAGQPIWHADCIYRRKQTTFVPEYYSGLNWRDAEHLIGKTVEYANHPDSGWHVGTLKDVSRNNVIAHFSIISDVEVHFSMYIRTCEETFKHQTINIGGVDLPMPATVAPCDGEQYWLSPDPDGCGYLCWTGDEFDISALKACRVHITEDRAKAWKDWWKSMVIDKMK